MNDFVDARAKTGQWRDAGLDEPLAHEREGNSRHADQSRRRMSGWAVITTHPQAERWACANLARRGYACFLPTFIDRRRDPVLRTLTRLVEVPLFAGYAFVHLDLRDHAPGVRTLLMDHDRVQFTRPGTVEALQQSETLRRAVPLPDSVWAPGMPCSFATGAFRDQPAVLVAIGGGVATVALPMLGELRELTVPIDRLVLRQAC